MAKGVKTGGRQKGTPNKITASAREAFQHAFNTIGGHEALAQWAKKNPSDFFKLYARLISQDLNLGGQKDNPVSFNLAQRLDEAIMAREAARARPR